jgi:hypothetical protein
MNDPLLFCCRDPLVPLPANETQVVTVFGPDSLDSPCTDLYTNQVVVYEGRYQGSPFPSKIV